MSETELDEGEKVRVWAEDRLLWTYLKMDDKGRLNNPPKTDDELHEFIRLAYGVTIPRKVITPGHTSPFKFIADLFFEKVKNALGFANRSGGKTYNLAILNHLELLFKPGVEITSAGAVLNQADRCYGYMQEFNHLPWFKKLCNEYHKRTNRRFLAKEIQSATEFDTGSLLEIITASEKGFRGPHPQKSRIDEIDAMEWGVLQTGLSMSKGKKLPNGQQVRGQDVFTSTRQYPDGPMQRLLDEASSKGIEIYEWNIWEVLERCPRRCKGDPVHGDCPIYEFCKGKAHSCDGFYKIDDFVDKARKIDKEDFETEWLNYKPERGKLIYPMFEHSRHVLKPDQLKRMTGFDYPQASWNIVSAIDFGSSPGHPFVYLKLAQIPGIGAWVVFYEYAAELDLLRNHAQAIKASPLWRPGETCYADWDAQDRFELLDLGITTRAASKDVDTGIDLVKTSLLGTPPKFNPYLYVWHTCQFTIKEFGLYARKTMADGSLDPNGAIAKKNDHAMDTIRYALMSYKGVAKPKYRGMQVPGI